jgi:two-component system, cell cycle sensor histidine kinase and response regulator CckA
MAGEWRWVHLTTESGLPSDVVSRLVQVAGDGPWALTRDGVARFDGHRWLRVAVPGNPDVFNGNLASDGRGGVALVAGGQLLVGNGSGLHLVPVLRAGRALQVEKCARAREGPVLLLTRDGTVYSWDGSVCRPHEPSHVLGRVYGIAAAGDQAAWASAERGLWSWEGARWRHRLPGGRLAVGAAFEMPDGGAFVYIDSPSAQRGLWEWHGESAPRPIRRAMPTPIESIAATPEGDVILVHNTGDLMVRTGKTWKHLTAVDLRVNEARSVGFLADGALWVASDHGVYVRRRSTILARTFAVPQPDDLNTVNAIAEEPGGRLMLATGRGIAVVDQGAAAGESGLKLEADMGTVTGLARDAQGRLWATSGYSFPGTRWRDASGTWHAAHLDPALDATFLHKVVVDSRGMLWFLGLSADQTAIMAPKEGGAGAFRVDVSDLAHPGVEHWGTTQGLPSGRVYSFAEGPDGAYWFGTIAGLSRWRSGEWTHWTAGGQLKDDRVFALAVDRNGDVWFAHQRGGGVGRLHGGKVTYSTVSDGLATDAIWDIRLDWRGRPWAAGEGGVSVLTQGGWAAFDWRAGLPNTRIWPVLPLRDRVWIGSRGDGLMALNVAEGVTPAPTVIAEPAVLDGDGLIVRWKAFAWWGEVEPSAILTRTRLDDGPWTPWTTNRHHRFPEVPPGTHTVAFESKGVLGTVNGGLPPLSVTIPPPFVRRPVFLLPVSALALAAGALLVTLVARQRRHHQDLHERERQLARVFQASPLPTAVTRFDDGRCLDVNDALLTLCGLTREQMLDRTPSESGVLLETLDRPGLSKALASGAPAPPFTLALRAASGEKLDLVAYTQLLDFAGTRAVLCQMLDVTEQQRLESQLRQAQKMESIGRLAGGVAHDFNNLLTVILGNASLVEAQLPDGDPRLEELEQVKIAGERAERLTRQLLAFARKQIVEPKVVNVNDVVSATLGMLQRLIGEDIELVARPAPNLDQVLIDPNQLEQVLLNMAVNARDAMPAGGTLTIRTQRVTVTAREARLQPEASAGTFVRLSVSDTGTGMDATIKARVFEPFFTTKGPGKGTGLGLATCYGVVKQAGGHILVDTELGRGTTFHVDLPLAPPDGAAGELVDRALESDGGSETVLLVEDEAQVLTLAANVLRHRGYHVLEASAGAEALQISGSCQGRLDILVTDVVMPHMRGTELASRLRAQRPDIKVLYVSGYPDDESFRQEVAADRFAFLPKPFTPSALAKKVRETLDEE